MNKNIIKGLALAGVLTASAAANAAIDTTAVTAGITEAQTAILAVLGALTALSIAIFGVSKVHSFIKRKAGA